MRVHGAIGFDQHATRLHEVRDVGLVQCRHPLQVIRKPEVVVREPGDDVGVGLLQDIVSVDPASAGSFGLVEHDDTLVADGLGRLLRAVVTAVADDEHLLGGARLLERRLQGQERRLTAVMG